MGSRLAMALDKDGCGLRFMLAGVDAWARTRGWNRLHALVLLEKAGATHNPFGPHSWEASIEEVGRFMEGVRTIPDLRQHNLTGMMLSHADMREADLSDLDLSGGWLSWADLRDASLDGTDLTGCKMLYANLTGASLRGANLTQTDLRYADLSGADLQDADLDDTWVESVVWDNTKGV